MAEYLSISAEPCLLKSQADNLAAVAPAMAARRSSRGMLSERWRGGVPGERV
jgi:hypothetical protein